MKSGFLSQQAQPKGRPLARADSAQEAAPGAAAAAAAAATQPPGRAAAPAPALAPSPGQAAAGLAECLQLLKGPTDERRFVGLLLVTRLLPAGDAESVRQVHAAIGPTFLTRLLLPLKSSTPPTSAGASEAAAAAAQQEAATCALGLAVLSSFARVADLAGGEEMLEKVPLLLNVVRAGGIGPLLAARYSAAAATAAAPGGVGTRVGQAPPVGDVAADAAAVQDALECVVAAARSGDEGAAVAAESGAVGAAVAVLQACRAEASEQLSLALQLLAAVLSEEKRRLALLAGDQATVLQHLLPALARVFALPAQQQQQQQLGTAAGSGRQGEELQRRLLAVQLEALHVLLLLLPLPQTGGGGGGGGGALDPRPWRGALWPAQLRQGLGLLLRGRISAVQRHSALQLADAVVDLVGSGWLVGADGGADVAGADVAGAAGAEAFFQLLVEVTKVETSVLLHDALAPHVRVPLASAPATAAGEWHAPVPRLHGLPASEDGSSEGGDGDHAAGAALAADLAGGGDEDDGCQAGGGQAGQGAGAGASADMQPLVKILSSEEDRRQLEEQLGREQREAAAGPQQEQQGDRMRRVDATQIPTEMLWQGPSEASGERAARMLPVCFALLEASIEALAADAQGAEEAEGSGGHGGQAGPALSDAVAQRALHSLEESVEVVLQYIEQTVGEESDQEAGHEAAGLEGSWELSPGRQALLLAAVRVLARFCAEAPHMFAPRLRALLPHLLPLRVDYGGVELQQQQWEEQDGRGSEDWEPELREHRPWMGTAADSPAEGTTFLLPALLQVTDRDGNGPGSERRLWQDALAAPAVLPHLLQYTRQCAAACSPAVTTAAADAADDALLYACQLLLNVFAGQRADEEEETEEEEEEGEAQRYRRRQLLRDGCPLPLLRALLRLASMRPVVPEEDCSLADVVGVARLLSALAALCGIIAATLATELHSGSPSSEQPLELSPEQQWDEESLEEAEEEAAAQRLRQRGVWQHNTSFLAQSDQRLPFLGPISGRLMRALCAQLLAGIRVAGQLTTPGGVAGDASRQLAAARSAVAADSALQEELTWHLDAAADAVVVLLQRYPPFLKMCREDAWVAAELAAVGTAGTSGVAGASPGLALFLHTLADCMNGW